MWISTWYEINLRPKITQILLGKSDPVPYENEPWFDYSKSVVGSNQFVCVCVCVCVCVLISLPFELVLLQIPWLIYG